LVDLFGCAAVSDRPTVVAYQAVLGAVLTLLGGIHLLANLAQRDCCEAVALLSCTFVCKDSAVCAHQPIRFAVCALHRCRLILAHVTRMAHRGRSAVENPFAGGANKSPDPQQSLKLQEGRSQSDTRAGMEFRTNARTSAIPWQRAKHRQLRASAKRERERGGVGSQ
jgi:hypothetical protein